MTFIEDPAKIQAPQHIAVGFYVDLATYHRYKKLAEELYKQKGQDEAGNMVPLIDNPQVNDLIMFAVQFFEQNYAIFQDYSNNKGGAQALIKDIIKKMGG